MCYYNQVQTGILNFFKNMQRLFNSQEAGRKILIISANNESRDIETR
jgi:hypothetical protein